MPRKTAKPNRPVKGLGKTRRTAKAISSEGAGADEIEPLLEKMRRINSRISETPSSRVKKKVKEGNPRFVGPRTLASEAAEDRDFRRRHEDMNSPDWTRHFREQNMARMGVKTGSKSYRRLLGEPEPIASPRLQSTLERNKKRMRRILDEIELAAMMGEDVDFNDRERNLWNHILKNEYGV